jgi:S1-C subfamily serine protease
MRRLWIIFSQTATICLAVLFVIATLKPEWLPTRAGLVPESMRIALVQQEVPPGSVPGAVRPDSYNDAVRKAAPSVVNIFTTKEVRVARNPLLNDPVLRRFFGGQLGDETQRASSLGSGVIVSSSGYILTNNHVVEAADEIEVALATARSCSPRSSAATRRPTSRCCASKRERPAGDHLRLLGHAARRRHRAGDRQSASASARR